ncbi:MAG: DUF5777 family beta-barrel protein [Balneolaceae bacterium]
MRSFHNLNKKLLSGIILLFFFTSAVSAQLPRERVQTDDTIDRIFWASTNIGISTIHNVAKNNLESSVMHTFGLVRGGIDRFYGLDDGANTKLGIDYGISDKFSIGLGRMTFNKIVDIRTKYNILQQTTSGSTPLSLGVKASLGITTLSGVNFEFSERLSYFASIMAAKKFDRLSVQITPMIAHFNRVNSGNENQLLGLGLLLSYQINNRFTVSTEYLPVLGNRNPSTYDAMAVALNIDTGGHVFQLFLTSSQWHNEQFIMANNRDRFWKGDFRFGFNIHRVFGLGGK